MRATTIAFLGGLLVAEVLYRLIARSYIRQLIGVQRKETSARA